MVKGSQGEQEMTGPEFRLAVDSTKMKSTLVREFSFQDGVLRISGTGYGHGVASASGTPLCWPRRVKAPRRSCRPSLRA